MAEAGLMRSTTSRQPGEQKHATASAHPGWPPTAQSRESQPGRTDSLTGCE